MTKMKVRRKSRKTKDGTYRLEPPCAMTFYDPIYYYVLFYCYGYDRTLDWKGQVPGLGWESNGSFWHFRNQDYKEFI